MNKFEDIVEGGIKLVLIYGIRWHYRIKNIKIHEEITSGKKYIENLGYDVIWSTLINSLLI